MHERLGVLVDQDQVARGAEVRLQARARPAMRNSTGTLLRAGSVSGVFMATADRPRASGTPRVSGPPTFNFAISTCPPAPRGARSANSRYSPPDGNV